MIVLAKLPPQCWHRRTQQTRRRASISALDLLRAKRFSDKIVSFLSKNDLKTLKFHGFQEVLETELGALSSREEGTRGGGGGSVTQRERFSKPKGLKISGSINLKVNSYLLL